MFVGASFLQRGSTLKEPYSNGSGIVRSDLYNYGAAHLLFSTNLGHGFEGLGGVQAGLRLGNSGHLNSGTEYVTKSVDPTALNFDAGLLLGANYMINERNKCTYLGIYALNRNSEGILCSSTFNFVYWDTFSARF